MIRTAIICLLIPLVRSEECTLSESEIINLRDSLHISLEYMQKEVGDEDAAICIGTARAGKSTLINYLIGNKLQAKRLKRFDTIRIITANNSIGPEIGAGLVSKTTIPSKWTSKKLQNLTLWDAPGFEDNRGAVQDITNAFYLYQLTKKVKSFKFILVINFNDILTDYPGRFLSLLNALQNFFGNKFQEVFPSISVIFSKVPDTFTKNIPVDIAFISNKINKFLTSNMTFSENSKKFLQYVINNKHRIAFFKKMAHEGNITSENIDFNILPAILNTSSIKKSSVQDLHPSISDNSKICLFNSVEKLMQLSEIAKMQQTALEMFDRKLNDLEILAMNSTINQTKIIQNNLTKIEEILNNACRNHSYDIYQKIEILETNGVPFEDTNDGYNLMRLIKPIKFIDYLLNTNINKQLDQIVNVVILTIHLHIKETTSLFDTIILNKTKEMHEQEVRNLKEKYRQEIINKQKIIIDLNDKDKPNIFERFINFIRSPDST